MSKVEPKIRFRPNIRKAVEAILWLAHARIDAGLPADMHALLKLLFFAEKVHLNKFGRPIVGDRFFARQYGPVPEITYDLLKREPLLVQEIDGHALPFDARGEYEITPTRKPDLSRLSESDTEALSEAFASYGRMTFAQLTNASHAAKAYRNAESTASQLMDYADFLDESEDKSEKVGDLAAISHRLRA
jgi:uncharacterized phage-associated protein